MKMNHQEILNKFTPYNLAPENVKTIRAIDAAAATMAKAILDNVPKGDDRDEAIRSLQAARFFANSGLGGDARPKGLTVKKPMTR